MLVSRYIFALGIVALFMVWVFPHKQEPTGEVSQLPQLSIPAANGAIKTLDDYRGKIIIVHFWASWCPPCLPELPELVKLAEDNPEKLVILAYSLDLKEQKMQLYYDVNFPNLPENFIPIWDEKGKVARETFFSFRYPESYLIGCDGTMAEKIPGAADNWDRTLEPHLQSCLAK